MLERVDDIMEAKARQQQQQQSEPGPSEPGPSRSTADGLDIVAFTGGDLAAFPASGVPQGPPGPPGPPCQLAPRCDRILKS